MIINYLKTAMRSFSKDKKHFLLNLIGFSVGLMAAFITALFAAYEYSYDNQHPHAQHTYRVHTDYSAWGLQRVGQADSKTPLSMQTDTRIEDIFILTEAEDIGYFSEPMPLRVQLNNSSSQLKNAYVATENIQDFVSLQVLSGDLQQTLRRPGYVALSQAEAKRFFGTSPAVGKTLQHENGHYTVGAVFADLPDNTHFVIDTLTAIPTNLTRPLRGYIYIRLAQGTDPDAIALQLTKVMSEKAQGRVKELSLSLHNMQTLHFASNGPFEMKQGGSELVMNVCVALTVLLLFIATVNCINLNIAAAAKRAKEVGVRKSLGASKVQLFSQFIVESLLMVLCAALVAVAGAELSLGYVNQLLERNLSLSFSVPLLFSAIGIVLVIGVLAGLYPAVFIASFSAKRVLSGDLQRGKTAIWVRKLTLSIQGGLSVALIIMATIIYQQIALNNDLPVGYAKKDRLIVHNIPKDAAQPTPTVLFKRIQQLTGVAQITHSNTILTNDMDSELHLVWPNGERIQGTQPSIETGFHAAETLGLELLAGRDFSPAYASDWMQVDAQGIQHFAILITPSLAALAGYNDASQLIGQTLTSTDGTRRAKIVGVVKDIKIGSARQQALPVSVNVAATDNEPLTNLQIKLVKGTNKHEVMAQITQIITEELGVADVDITTVEGDYARAHINENRIKSLVMLFSGLAILLTCMGIFGLASFSALRRQKEVSVRKVLGASRLSLVNLLGSEFLKVIALGIAVAIPLTYWLVGDWLAGFNERIEQSMWIYLFAALVVAAITWLTVASLAFKAASTRPSLILRDE